MLKVFLSSTFRDLSDQRRQILDDLNEGLIEIGMENFVPDGRTPHEVSISELKTNDIVIFLISPWYGTSIEECEIEGCKADCPLREGTDKISYTHGEFKTALAEDKPHQTYLLDRDWVVIGKLNEWDWKEKEEINWSEIRNWPIFDGIPNEDIKHYVEVRTKLMDFKKEAEREFCQRVSDVSRIKKDLAKNIPKWYSEGKVNIRDFPGRRKDLAELLEKMDESVEVYGVGGIGKTTLIQVALLIQKLKGKKIVTVGTSQSYRSGSGYKYFKDKVAEGLYTIVGDRITLNDIIDALSIDEIIKMLDKNNKLKAIIDKMTGEGVYLFIDDFHLADEDVQELVTKISGGVVLASKIRSGVVRVPHHLLGIDEDQRDEFIDHLISDKKFKKSISDDARETIKRIAEGHPVSTEILIKNYEKIDFRKIENYKHSFNMSDPKDTEEFLNRVVKEILSEGAFDLLKSLSAINTDLESNIDVDAARKTHPTGFNEHLSELVDAGMLEKRMGYEGVYIFSYKHIQEAINDDNGEIHGMAADYYRSQTAHPAASSGACSRRS